MTSCEGFLDLLQQLQLCVADEGQGRTWVVCPRCPTSKNKKKTKQTKTLKKGDKNYSIKLSCNMTLVKNQTNLPTRWMYDSTVVGKSKLTTLQTFWKSTPLETPYSLSFGLQGVSHKNTHLSSEDNGKQ